jgi:DNA-binding GntR family transcriptional regulator
MHTLPNPTHVAWAPGDERPAYEIAYEQLRREIVADQIPAGARMVEVDIAERLQLSRTPVREALRRLESDGYVQRAPSGRLVVTPTGPDDLGDLALVRIEVDGLAARLAAQRGSSGDWRRLVELAEALGEAADEAALVRAHGDLHREIYGIAFGPRMASFFGNQLLPYVEAAVNVGPGSSFDPGGAADQHVTLVRALSGGDVARAVKAARDHAASGARYAHEARAERVGP